MSKQIPEEILRSMDLVLPAAPAGVGAYVPWSRTGNLIVTSFQLPWRAGRLSCVGRVGEEVSMEAALEASRICALNGLAQLRDAAGGELQRIRVVRLDGHVGCTESFEEIPQVLNAASELLTAVLGTPHARTALGHQVMPLRVPVMLGFLAEIASS